MLADNRITSSCAHDCGSAAQSIMLGACERVLGACLIGSVQRSELRRSLGLPGRYEILLVVALGVPAQTVRLDEVGADGRIEYGRDAEGVHHVPKRSLDEIILDL